jgi:release factor glutamine methyltransferase
MELLMARVLGVDRLGLYLAHDRPLSDDERRRLRELVARRGRHEPVAHLLGDWEFFGLELAVSPDVLIPRPETEGLVELALAHEGPCRAVDLGTGSGAIAIALATRRPDWEIWAIDVSAAALDVARDNVARHALEARIHLAEGSYWDPVLAHAPFDLCISNPPYVDPADADQVAEDVKRYEPGLALWTPEGQPTAAYEAILAGVAAGLRQGGLLLLETGPGVAQAALELLESCDEVIDAELIEDLAGLPRYLRARRA